MRLGILLVLITCSASWAQTGPGGVGTTNGATSLRGWWGSDAGVTVASGAVSNWADQSGYGNHLSQVTAGNRPTSAVSAALNNRTHRSGLLAVKNNKSRLEFREVLDDNTVMAAIHEFEPSLPWWLSRLTQPPLHLLVMNKFGNWLRSKM